MPELVFFLGKGGVGKTTVSSAYATRIAARYPRKRVLLVSTDPAHSLSDVLENRIGSSPKAVALGSRRVLLAWEIDSERLFREFLDEHKHKLVEAVERGSLFTADEIASLLETALPGMSEMGALLAIHDAVESGKYDTLVVDTAPFGHTLRLFGLPEQFEKLLNFLQLAAERDQVLAQHFGGTLRPQADSFLGEWRDRLQQIKNAFETARLVLVTTAEEFALRESTRCIRQLRETNHPMRLSAIVLNRVVQNPGRCLRCQARAKAASKAQQRLGKEYKQAKLFVATDPGFPIAGVPLLRQFADAVFGRKPARWRTLKLPGQFREPGFSPAKWPALPVPLTFVLGKGGVGKTTVSAALALYSRQVSKNHEVEICSVDPAPSLDDVFQANVSDIPLPVLGDPGLRASEMDSQELYRHWVAEMRDEIDAATSVRGSGVQVDLSYERQLFSELLEIVPPGLDEVLAIFRIIELSQQESRKVIIDMAPTGHALELLRTPERILVWSRLLLKSLASHRKLALAREVAVRIAELEVRARELSRALKRAQAAVYAVMLPEPLPDRETERLLQELRGLGIEPEAVFVNRVLLLGKSRDCNRCGITASLQARLLVGVKKRLGMKTVYAIPALDEGPAGKRGLREITRKLWQLK